MTHSEARERVLQAAETLFVERGYEAVTIKDIAKAAGIHHASLYHHIPEGKSALFVEVMTRHMERHRVGIQQALSDADGDLHAQLGRIAGWLLSQPPVDIVRMVQSDLRAISDTEAAALNTLMFEATMLPIHTALEAAQQRDEIAHPNLGNIAGAIFSAIEGLHSIPDLYVQGSRLAMADELIDVFLRGMRKD